MTAIAARTCRVLEAMALGLTIQEVAGRLDMSIDEVRRRLADAIGSLGASSRLDAIMTAARRGLIDLPR